MRCEGDDETADRPPHIGRGGRQGRGGKGRNASPAVKQPAGTEMLSARVEIATARRFRSLAKLRGEKVQSLLQTVLTEYLERNRF